MKHIKRVDPSIRSAVALHQPGEASGVTMKSTKFIVVAAFAGSLGCGASPPDEFVESEIYNGAAVPLSQVAMTGAVEILDSGLCSGTLITPWWVVTAQHCLITDQGTVGIPGTAKSAKIAPGGVFNKPGYVDNAPHCALVLENDITILKLASPIYLTKSDGRVWNLYTRDLDRAQSPAPPNGSYVDLYGYGCDDSSTAQNCTGAGVQRFATFFVNPHGSTFDFDGSGYANHGDSGGGLLRPGFGAITQSADYRLAGVDVCIKYGAFWDPYGVAVSWSAFASFFDATIPASEFSRFNAPSLIYAAMPTL